MQFHHHGYVTGDPRVQPAAGVGLGRPDELPDAVDVLIVGTGPAGMITAAQLSRFPGITTRIVEQRPGRLEIGRADGIQARTVETFQAFGFAERLAAEAFHVTEITFWKPDPADPSRIVRAGRAVDDATGLSEFPHLTVNQARVLDYFAEYMANAPTRMRPDYGLAFSGLEIDHDDEHPVAVTLTHTAGEREGRERLVRARYVVGADGAHSRVRQAIGCRFEGAQANHAWGVLDVLALSDFPDIRLLCTIHSGSGGNILLIPREGGHLFRIYVDLGEVPPEGDSAVRQTGVEEMIAKANEILHPYSIDVREVAWHSVYEVGHRLSDRFDDVPASEAGRRAPRVFILGDACHTHSAKGGQGMNVSLQDGFNLGWKLGHVLDGRGSRRLLSTYGAERKAIARNLIAFDKAWSSLMAKRPDEFDDPAELERFFVEAEAFRTGFMTEYEPSLLIGPRDHQAVATGFPIGRRFASARVSRVIDTNPVHLGHLATADGRWRIYVFADAAPPGESAAVARLADWLTSAADSPLAAVPAGVAPHDWFDVKVIYQQPYRDVDVARVPAVFKPRVGPFELVDHEAVFAALADDDIFERRGIDRDGAIVVVRPDQYVAHVLPLTAPDELAAFFAPILRDGRATA